MAKCSSGNSSAPYLSNLSSQGCKGHCGTGANTKEINNTGNQRSRNCTMRLSEGHVQYDGHDLHLTPTTHNATTRTLTFTPPTYLLTLLFCLRHRDGLRCAFSPPYCTRRPNTLPSTINNAPNLLSNPSVELLRRISIDIVLILSSLDSTNPISSLYITLAAHRARIFISTSSPFPSPLTRRCSLLVYPPIILVSNGLQNTQKRFQTAYAFTMSDLVCC
jgi:hypothetical protein